MASILLKIIDSFKLHAKISICTYVLISHKISTYHLNFLSTQSHILISG